MVVQLEAVHAAFEPVLLKIAKVCRPEREWSPSERDLEIYRDVIVGQRSQREAAAAHQLSATRVRQLVTQVGNWLANRTPRQFSGLSKEKRLNLAAHLERERLTYLYEQAVEGWRKSLEPVTSVKTVETKEGPREERIVRSSAGRPALLREAARLARDLAALEGVTPQTYLQQDPKQRRPKRENEHRFTPEQRQLRYTLLRDSFTWSKKEVERKLALLDKAAAGDEEAFVETVDFDREYLEWELQYDEQCIREITEDLVELEAEVEAQRETLASPDRACEAPEPKACLESDVAREQEVATALEELKSANGAVPNSLADEAETEPQSPAQQDEAIDQEHAPADEESAPGEMRPSYEHGVERRPPDAPPRIDPKIIRLLC